MGVGNGVVPSSITGASRASRALGLNFSSSVGNDAIPARINLVDRAGIEPAASVLRPSYIGALRAKDGHLQDSLSQCYSTWAFAAGTHTRTRPLGAPLHHDPNLIKQEHVD